MLLTPLKAPISNVKIEKTPKFGENELETPETPMSNKERKQILLLPYCAIFERTCDKIQLKKNSFVAKLKFFRFF